MNALVSFSFTFSLSNFLGQGQSYNEAPLVSVQGNVLVSDVSF